VFRQAWIQHDLRNHFAGLWGTLEAAIPGLNAGDISMLRAGPNAKSGDETVDGNDEEGGNEDEDDDEEEEDDEEDENADEVEDE
jgi:hypothetical protein